MDQTLYMVAYGVPSTQLKMSAVELPLFLNFSLFVIHFSSAKAKGEGEEGSLRINRACTFYLFFF